jgi:hypothetical protein
MTAICGFRSLMGTVKANKYMPFSASNPAERFDDS